MAPFTEQLLNNLFKALALPGSAENEYIMKGKSDCSVVLMLPIKCHIQSDLGLLIVLFVPSSSVSKAIMRSFSLLQEVIVPYIPTLIGQLTHKLLLVSKVTNNFLPSIKSTGRFRKKLVWGGKCVERSKIL